MLAARDIIDTNKTGTAAASGTAGMAKGTRSDVVLIIVVKRLAVTTSSQTLSQMPRRVRSTDSGPGSVVFDSRCGSFEQSIAICSECKADAPLMRYAAMAQQNDVLHQGEPELVAGGGTCV